MNVKMSVANNFENIAYGLVYLFEQLNIQDICVTVPLKKVYNHVKVVDFTAEVTVVQEYENQESNPIEASYIFPIEEGGAVISFDAEIDGRSISTKVKEKQSARKEYQDAVSSRKGAFLLEELKNDIFEIKVGHLNPGCKAKITLTYLIELPVEGKAKRLTIPTTIVPKYVPRSDNSEEAQKIAAIKYSRDSPAPLEVTLEASMNGKIIDFSSPSHKLTYESNMEEDGKCKAVARFSGTTMDMDRDLIVLIENEGSNGPALFLERNEENGTTCGMLSLIPSFSLKEQPVELIFLVDRSGSMSGTSIKQAVRALELFMHSLPVSCFFNIFSFGSHFSSLFEDSQQYTDDTLHKAKEHILSMDADYGGTELFKPLEHIFKVKPREGYLRQIFVLTDGAVSNDEQVIHMVKKNVIYGRLFSLGLGNSCSRHLVKGIARAGNGTASFASVNEDLRPKVMVMLKNALQPAISNVSVTWLGDVSPDDNMTLKSPELERKNTLLGYRKPKAGKEIPMTGQAPITIPPVFDGSRLLVYRLFNKNECLKGVKVTAETLDGPLSLEVGLLLENMLEGSFIHQLAARKRIQDLEESLDIDEDQRKKAVVSLGTKYNLASKYTSFVGVDPNQSGQEFWSMSRRDVASQFPFGTSAKAMTAFCLQQTTLMSSAKRMVSKSAYRGIEVDGFDTEDGFDAMAESCPDSDSDVEIVFCSDKTSEMSARSSTSGNLPELSDIIKLQKANGTFRWEKALEKAFNMSLNDVLSRNAENVDPDLWITAMVVVYLEVKTPDSKELWELVVEKSRKLLAKNFGAERATNILQGLKQYFC